MVVQDIHQEETDINMPYPSSIKSFINPISRTNLVCYLDASNPSSYPGSGTVWYDLTGRGNNCALTNGAYFDTEGGGSIYFDGANDLGVIAAASDIDFPADFTIETWVHWAPFLASSFDGGSGWYGLGIMMRRWNPDTGTWALASYGDADLFWQQFNPSVNMFGYVGYHVRNRWNHVVVTRTNGTMRMYQDGVLLGTATSNLDYTTVAPINIGQWDGIAYAQIRMGVLRIYKRGLTTTEVLRHFQSEKNRFTNELSNIASQSEVKTTHYSGAETRFSAAKYATDGTTGTTRRNPTLTLTDFKNQIDQTNKTGCYPKLIQNLSIDNDKKGYISNLSQESMNSVMNQLENVNKMAQKLYQDILLLKSQSINKNGVYPSSKYR
jgi:hypothetical protein